MSEWKVVERNLDDDGRALSFTAQNARWRVRVAHDGCLHWRPFDAPDEYLHVCDGDELRADIESLKRVAIEEQGGWSIYD